MGDNLVAARQFSGLCQDSITALMIQETRESSDAIASLTAIQSSAKDMRARSISRAAQSAIEEYEGVYSASQRAGALLVLNKLVRQYTDGLDEIAPEHVEDFEGPSAEEVADWKQARDVFIPLQKFAKTEGEVLSLSQLASLGPFAPGDVAQHNSESFELLMPAITDESLRQARETSKAVSVSYATDDISMDEMLAVNVQEALIEICQGLVQSSVEAPSERKTQGLGDAAHIAITARRKGATFDILVSCEGALPADSVLTGPKQEKLRQKGALLALSSRDNLVRIDITGLPILESEDLVRVYDQALGMRA